MHKSLVVVSGGLLAVLAATVHASTVTYTYDARGRLTKAKVTDGTVVAAERTYGYDAAGNRTQVVVTGSAGSGTVSIQPTGAVANATSSGVSLTVNVTGTTAPTGMVTFMENGVFIGSAYVTAGQASVFLEGFSLGNHTITASYSGDASNAPQTFTFTIKVQNLSWLPAVLEIILSN